jgi:hypothetical protein
MSTFTTKDGTTIYPTTLKNRLNADLLEFCRAGVALTV